MTNQIYKDDMFRCELDRLKNLNQELYKRFIKPIYIPILTLVSCFLLTFSKVQSNFSLKTIKVFLYIFAILVISETLMRYVDDSKWYLVLFFSLPIFIYLFIYNFLILRLKYD